MDAASETPSLPAQVLGERTHLAIPSLPHWIEPTAEFLRQKAVLAGACSETRSGTLLVALLEAVTNAIIHGNLGISSELKECPDDAFARALAERSSDPALARRPVDIAVSYDGEACIWVITDEGHGFDVERVLARCLSDDPEVMLASGRGILMMHSFLDSVRYELGGRRAVLTLRRASAGEKRHDVRVPLNLPLQVAPLRTDGTVDWPAAYDAVSRNLSQGGVALLQEGLAAGGRVLVGIPAGDRVVYVPAEVRHSRALGEGGVELGCVFLTAPAAGESVPACPDDVQHVEHALASVLERHDGPRLPEQERRGHPRVVFNRPVEVFAGGEARPHVAYARDLSKGGMAIITQTALPASVVVRFSPHEGGPALRIQSRVARCSKIQDGFYDVGIEFLRLESAEGA